MIRLLEVSRKQKLVSNTFITDLSFLLATEIPKDSRKNGRMVSSGIRSEGKRRNKESG